MQTKSRKYNINGWLILDKPQAMTSNAVLGVVKRLLRPQKAGYAGTLDPLASGVLAVALGQATKTISFVVDDSKCYEFTVKWGIATDTCDADGRIIKQSSVIPTEEAIKAIIPEFIGAISQRPPKFSAIKVNGARAYDLARQGKDFTLSDRQVVIDDLRLQTGPRAEHAHQSDFVLKCGKGVYVRSLARDMGLRLGSYGHVCSLRRVNSGPFTIADAVTLPQVMKLTELAAGARDDWLDTNLKPLAIAITAMPEYNITDPAALTAINNGQAIIVRDKDFIQDNDKLVRLTWRRDVIGLAKPANGKLYPKRLFNHKY